MFVLGHVGIGTRLVQRLRLPFAGLCVGCLLPDLIDKPLFYLVGPERVALIEGTRTFGHTGLFLLVVLAASLRWPALRAVAIGMATHLLLDLGGDAVSFPPFEHSTLLAVFFPLFGVRFPQAPFSTLSQQLSLNAHSSYVLLGEIVGAGLLLRRFRHSS